MKTWLVAAALAGLFAFQDPVPDAPKQDPPAPAPPKKEEPAKKDVLKCDMAKVEQRDWCDKCQKFLATWEVAKGACKTCATKTVKLNACVKIAYLCRMHGNKLHRKQCSGTPQLLIEKTFCARVLYQCDKCSATSTSDKGFPHSVEKCDGKLSKVCEKSGEFPHGGEEPK